MTNVPIKPLLDNVIMVKESADQVRASGIIIPAMFDDQEEAVVVAVGPGKFDGDGLRVPMQVKPGDHVLFNKHQVQELEVEGQRLLAVRDEHIRAIL